MVTTPASTGSSPSHVTADAPEGADATPVLELRGVGRRFGRRHAVRDVDLGIAEGEFVTLLGPSGCGKTTTLRMVAGLLEPTSGTVLIDGADVAGIPARLRRTNLVFQNYALFPHLSVLDNVAFGLRAKRVGAAAATAAARQLLEVVRMADRSDARPSVLSGGQQQRVALARALVNHPRVVLLDEPLGALDLKLRREMQVELKRIQDELGLTFVHVTHDQEEALALSDRIVIMRAGRVEQAGSPTELYDRPRNAYVASFLGSANVIGAVAESGDVAVTPAGDRLPISTSEPPRSGDRVTICVRPEQLDVVDAADASGTPADGVPTRPWLEAALVEPIFQGSHTKLVCETDDGVPLTAVVPRGHPSAGRPLGSRVRLGWDAREVWTVVEPEPEVDG